jgi:hypothetical protein
VDGTGSGSCPVAGLVLAVLKLWVQVLEIYLISKVDLREIGCEDGRWMDGDGTLIAWRILNFKRVYKVCKYSANNF